MILPNGGFTVEVQNIGGTIREIGDQILEIGERTFVHFITTGQLREAIQLNDSQKINILGAIPTDMLAALADPSYPTPSPQTNQVDVSGYVYRDELYAFLDDFYFDGGSFLNNAYLLSTDAGNFTDTLVLSPIDFGFFMPLHDIDGGGF